MEGEHARLIELDLPQHAQQRCELLLALAGSVRDGARPIRTLDVAGLGTGAEPEIGSRRRCGLAS